MAYLDDYSILIRVDKPAERPRVAFVDLTILRFINADAAIDVDASRLVHIGERQTCVKVFDLLKEAFLAKTISNLRRQRSGKSIWSPCTPLFPLLDEHGVSIVDQMTQFITENRIFLGDEGSWKILTMREHFLKRPGMHLLEIAQGAIRRQLPPVKALPDADHTDDFASFRFPSTSCLYGVSHPLAELRGAIRFGQLFIRDGAGVYVAFDEDEVLYVGMTRHFSRRLSNAESHHKLKIAIKLHPNARVALIHYPVWKSEALKSFLTSGEEDAAWGEINVRIHALETACIHYYRPRYNGRNDGAAE